MVAAEPVPGRQRLDARGDRHTSVASCVAADAASGSITLGGTTFNLDGTPNLRQGLPSPAGRNSLTLTNSTTRFGGGFFIPANFAPTQGRQLSTAWHAAALP